MTQESGSASKIKKSLENATASLSALKMLVADIDELPQEKKKLLTDIIEDTLGSINHINSEEAHPIQAIMVDDNKNLSIAWEMDALSAGINLIAFNSPHAFIEAMSDFKRGIDLYIDINLNSDINGLELSEIAYKQGFKSIYLITGNNISDINRPPWVKAIYGKDSPFTTNSTV